MNLMSRSISSQLQVGLTLIELLVAVSIFSVLGVMTYRAVDAALNSQSRISEHLSSLQVLARADLRLQRILRQSLAGGGENARPVMALREDGQLHFLRIDPSHGLEHAALGLRGNQLLLQVWSGREAAGAPLREEILLESVAALNWHFLLRGREFVGWPASQEPSSQLPDAIGWEIEWAPMGRIQRLIALRG